MKRRISIRKLAGKPGQMKSETNAADAELMQTVEWENANQLDLWTLLFMVSDGYRFTIDNGRISSVGIRMAEAA
ncbi:MAG: hypothetical protein LUI87_16155 [Lachnospiraceae bacterium]|nr:hypothetical protein [Lachnospiraceae bacterium]